MKNLIDILKNYMDVCNSSRHIQLIGGGGTGKTYLCFDAYLQLLEMNDCIPIYIQLTETRIADEGYSIFRFIERNFMNLTLVRSESVETQNTQIINMFKSSEKKIIMFLDGVNEILDYSKNVMNPYGFFEEIRQLSEVDNISLVITSRYKIYHEIFRGFSAYSVNPLSIECITAVKEKKGITSTKDIESLLQSPFYLDKYIKSVQLSNVKNNEKITGGELIDIYIRNIILQFCQNNHLHEDSVSALKLRFCLIVFLPELAMHMYKNGSENISVVEINKCFQAIKITLKTMEYEKEYYPYGEWWDNYSLRELIEDYLLTTEIIYHNPENKGVFYFSHEDLFSFFCARWWLLHAEHFEDFNQDVVFISNNYTIRKFIGELTREYCFQHKKSCLSEASPIEKYMRKTKGVIGDDNVAQFNRECIEIMKIARERITADYSNLDLRFADFSTKNVENGKFNNSLITRDTFSSKTFDSSIVFLYSKNDIVIVGDKHAHIVCYSLKDNSIHYSLRLSSEIDRETSVSFQSEIYFIDEIHNCLYISCALQVYKINCFTGEIIDSIPMNTTSNTGFYYDSNDNLYFFANAEQVEAYNEKKELVFQKHFLGFNPVTDSISNNYLIKYNGRVFSSHVFNLYKINIYGQSLIKQCSFQISDIHLDFGNASKWIFNFSKNNTYMIFSYIPIDCLTKNEVYGRKCVVVDLKSGKIIDRFETYSHICSFNDNCFMFIKKIETNSLKFKFFVYDFNSMEIRDNEIINNMLYQSGYKHSESKLTKANHINGKTIFIINHEMIVFSPRKHIFPIYSTTGYTIKMMEKNCITVHQLGERTYDLTNSRFLSENESKNLESHIKFFSTKRFKKVINTLLREEPIYYIGGLPYNRYEEQQAFKKNLLNFLMGNKQTETKKAAETTFEFVKQKEAPFRFYSSDFFEGYIYEYWNEIINQNSSLLISIEKTDVFFLDSKNLVYIFYHTGKVSGFGINITNKEIICLFQSLESPYNGTGKYIGSVQIDEKRIALLNNPLYSQIINEGNDIHSYITYKSNNTNEPIDIIVFSFTNAKEISMDKKSHTLYISTNNIVYYLDINYNETEEKYNIGIKNSVEFLPVRILDCDFSGIKILDDENGIFLNTIHNNGGIIIE